MNKIIDIIDKSTYILFQLISCVYCTLRTLYDDLNVSWCLMPVCIHRSPTQNPRKSPNLAHTCHSSAKAIKPGSRPSAVSVKDFLETIDQDTGNMSDVFLMQQARRVDRLAQTTCSTGNEKKPEGIL